MSLLEKYRPKGLDDVLGQPEVVRALKLFVADPSPQAFLLFGDSGVGKTATAIALAADLGCAIDEEEMGGLFQIPSGCQTAESVRDAVASLRYRPLMGSGWRVLVVNECDRMSTQAENVWLDALERLGPMQVVIFTTNNPEKLTERLRQRCDCYAFSSSTEDILPCIVGLARRVWLEEGLCGDVPGIENIGVPTLEGQDAMHCSFRVALQQLGRLVREAKQGGGQQLGAAVKQMVMDGAGTSAVKLDCQHCRREFTVPVGSKKAKCPRCRRVNAI